jgi:hypothetical protein
MAGIKRRRFPYESARDEERARRIRIIATANIHASLRSIIGPEAEFRGQQEKVIESVIREAGPFI